jgi:hypothetical protein
LPAHSTLLLVQRLLEHAGLLRRRLLLRQGWQLMLLLLLLACNLVKPVKKVAAGRCAAASPVLSRIHCAGACMQDAHT